MASVEPMDEALKVMDRLARIESLEREGCPAGVLLGEVRALLHEAEAWVRVEPGGTARAQPGGARGGGKDEGGGERLDAKTGRQPNVRARAENDPVLRVFAHTERVKEIASIARRKEA